MTDVLDVEWWHIGESVGATCERCSSTVRPLKEVFWEFRPIFSARRIRIRVREIVPFHEKIGESNTALLPRIPLGDLLDEVRIETRSSPVCACMTKNDAECRAFVCGDQMYEKSPADLIRRAAIRDAGP